MTSPSRFFLAHSKSCGDLEIDELRRITVVMLGALSRGQPFEVVMGRDYFHARFKAAGSWDAWTREVATAVSYLTREPIFKAILVSPECAAALEKNGPTVYEAARAVLERWAKQQGSRST